MATTIELDCPDCHWAMQFDTGWGEFYCTACSHSFTKSDILKRYKSITKEELDALRLD